MSPAPLVALVLGEERGALVGACEPFAGPAKEAVRRAAGLESQGRPRWVWWSAREVVPRLWPAGLVPDRSWDVAEVHRLLAGGWEADPATAWAHVHGLPSPGRPRPGGGDLFDFFDPGDVLDPPRPASGGAPTPGSRPAPVPGHLDAVVRPDGQIRPEVAAGAWQATDDSALSWARALLDCAEAQGRALGDHPRHRHTAWSESAASVLCAELQRDGLPLHRPTATALIEAAAGPRPRDPAHALAIRADRDRAVTACVPGHERTDLRSPEQVRALLAAAGIDVPDTRKHRLAAYRGAHPVVDALLAWRAAERIATTYGYHWLDAHVGPDDRLRGRWTACDGAAGRMTAENGLHNLPAALRPAVRAEPGHVFVRADLGQVEPRVLAAVSGDPAFRAATSSADLYAPVARALGIDRAQAKIAVLAAMYGQTSGAAGEALRRLTRAYPSAVNYLDRAYDAGASGGSIRTYGGRLVGGPVADDGALSPAALEARRAARGRFLRNASIQGAAAELFKSWAATVRVAVRPLDARIVLCLHDELLIHAPMEQARWVASCVEESLAEASARWCGGQAVTFVSDTTIVPSWADAKP